MRGLPGRSAENTGDELSANAAAIEAFFRKKPTALEKLILTLSGLSLALGTTDVASGGNVGAPLVTRRDRWSG